MPLCLSMLLAFCIGFAIQWCYAPGTTTSVTAGMLKTVSTMSGSLIAYYIWYR